MSISGGAAGGGEAEYKGALLYRLLWNHLKMETQPGKGAATPIAVS